MVAKFTICAILPKFQGQDPEPMWFTVEVWGQNAEWITNNLKKGDRALVQGDLREDTWTDRTTGEVKRASVIRRPQVEKQWAPAAAAQQVTPGADLAPAPRPAPAPAPVHQPAPPAQQGQQGWAPPAAAGAAGPVRPAPVWHGPPWPTTSEEPPF